MRAKWLLSTITYPQHREQFPEYSGHANTCWHLSYGYCYPLYLFLLLLGPTAINITAYNNTAVKRVTWLEVRNLKTRHQKAVFPPKALQEIHSLPFPATRGHLHSLACGLFPASLLPLLSLPLILQPPSQKNLCDCTEPIEILQNYLPISRSLI